MTANCVAAGTTLVTNTSGGGWFLGVTGPGPLPLKTVKGDLTKAETGEGQFKMA